MIIISKITVLMTLNSDLGNRNFTWKYEYFNSMDFFSDSSLSVSIFWTKKILYMNYSENFSWFSLLNHL